MSETSTTGASFGARLQRARAEAGLSQTALAGSDLSPSYISHLESGRREPTTAVVLLLARRLGLAPTDLVPVPGSGPTPPHDLVLAQAALGLGDPGEALALLAPWAARLGDVELLVSDPVLSRMAELQAAALERSGRLDDAVRVLEGLREAGERAPERLPWVATTVSLIRIYRESGDLARAIELGELALRRGSELGIDSVPGFAALVSTVAGAYAVRGDLRRAQVILDDLLERLGDDAAPDDRAKALWNAAINATERGHAGEGMRLVEEAVELASRGSDLLVRVRLRYSRAWILLQQDPPLAEEARSELRALLPEARQHAGGTMLGPVLSELARAELFLGNPEAARHHAAASLESLDPSQRLERAHSLVLLGAASVGLGEESVGVSLLEDAANALAEVEASRYAALAWHQLAEVYRSIGDVDRALEAMRRALDLSGLGLGPTLPVTGPPPGVPTPVRARTSTP